MYSFLSIPLAFLDNVSGHGIVNLIEGVLFLYYAYFAIALMGNIAGLMIHLGYSAVKKLWIEHF